jgi:hypothetical protein
MLPPHADPAPRAGAAGDRHRRRVPAVLAFLAVLALVFGLLARSRAGHIRGLRLVGFVLVWFVAETVALVMLTGLWVVSGFGGRLRTEP